MHRLGLGIGIAAGGCARDEDLLVGDVGALVGRVGARVGGVSAFAVGALLQLECELRLLCVLLGPCGSLHASHESSQRLRLRQLRLTSIAAILPLPERGS